MLAWAVAGGAVAALVLGATDLSTRGMVTPSAFNGAILMLLAGVVVGHVARLTVTAGERLHRAVELEAATRERERLARDIHDSVLQVLALVQRRGAHLDGEAGELARLAGEQEVALRSLISGAAAVPAAAADAPVDLRTLLGRWVLVEDEGSAVTVSIRDEGPGFPPERWPRRRHRGGWASRRPSGAG